jgi:alpha-L-glutamate ligase-like protein
MRPYNSARAKEIADDKILSKKILSRHGIPTAEIYKVIRNHKQLNTMRWEELPKSFALKPNIGTGGSGILIFYGKKKGSLEWIMPDGNTMNAAQLRNHISKILDGQYSMGNRKDTAIIEERVVNHPVLRPYSYKGIPDIRVIVFNKVPIMAELRLPTYESGGKANLHAGGIGVGIDIATGITTIAIHRRGASPLSDIYDIIETTLDDKKLPLRGIQIPFWKDILEISIKCQEAVGLGYLGADIALDRDKGPIVFELNARAGLAIQIANMSGMRSRMERVRGLKIKNPAHGIRVAQNLFGGEVEDELEAISGRQVIGLVEKIRFYPCCEEEDTLKPATQKKKTKETEKIKGKARINTGIIRSKISSVMAQRIGFRPALEYFKEQNIPEQFKTRAEAREYLEEHRDKITGHKDIVTAIVTGEDGTIAIRPIVSVTFDITGEKITAEMLVSRKKGMPYPAVLGRRDLKPFLLDASKTFSLH